MNVFGSAVKTYPSKNKRVSRSYSYRPSSVFQRTSVFDNDEPDDAFDKLINDEKQKKSFVGFSNNTSTTSNLKNQTNQRISILNSKPSIQRSIRLPVLQNLGNVPNVPTYSAEHVAIVKKSIKIKYDGKENILKHHSRLYLSDEDSTIDPYEFNLDVDGTGINKKQKRNADRTSRVHRAEIKAKLSKVKVKRLQDFREKQRKGLLLAGAKDLKAVSTPAKDANSGQWKWDVSEIRGRNLEHSYTESVKCENSSIVSPDTATKHDDISPFEKSSHLFYSQSFKNRNIRKNLSFLDTCNEESRKLLHDSTEFSCCGKHTNSGSNEQPSSGSESSNNTKCLKTGSEAIAFSRKHVDRDSKQFNPVIMSTPENKKDTGAESANDISRSTSFKVSQEMDVLRDDVEEHSYDQMNQSSVDSLSGSSSDTFPDVDESEGEFADITKSGGIAIQEANLSRKGSSFCENYSNLQIDDSPVHKSNDDILNVTSQFQEMKRSCVIETNDTCDISNTVGDCKERSIKSSSQIDDDADSLAPSLQNLTLNSDNSTAETTCSQPETTENDLKSLTDGIENVLHISGESSEANTSNELFSESSFSGSESSQVSGSPIEFRGFTGDSIERARLKKEHLTSALSAPPLGSNSESSSSESSSDFSDKYQTVVDLRESDECTIYEEAENISVFEKPSKKRYSRQAILLQAPQNGTEPVLHNEDVDLTSLSTDSFSTTAKFTLHNMNDETFTSEDSFLTTVVDADSSRDASMSKKCVPEIKVEECDVIDCIDTSIPGEIIELDAISPIEKIKKSVALSLRSRRSKRLSERKTVLKNQFPAFEPVTEENCEEVDEEYCTRFESTRTSDLITSSYTNNNFTMRRKKTCFLPTVIEVEADEDEESRTTQTRIDSRNSIKSQLSSVSINGATILQSIHLEKGKKWRRSFMTLKNIIDHKFGVGNLDEENKGRQWKENITNLINSQNDAALITRDLEECSTLKTGSDETTVAGFKEGDTISAQYGLSDKARFSICVVNSSHANEHGSQNENAAADLSCSSFLDGIRESLVDGHEIQAGDYSRILGLPVLDRSLPESATEIVLLYCQQNEPLPFETCFPDSVLQKCRKIGEGVYGEVFMVKNKSRCSVLKIIPIEGDQLVNGEKQKKFGEILSELVIAVQLSNLKKRRDFYTECFAEVQNCRCVYGRYPERLITLWKEYDLSKGSENDSPKMFKDNQLYIILELNHGGEDVEAFGFGSAQESLSVFNQVTHALAVAEQAFMFEHRDLHWGNILVSRTKNKETNFIIGSEKKAEKLHGVKVTIIDYTLSRISLNNRTLFNDLELDPDLFIAEGDFQFKVYPLMRKAVENCWDRFVPKTNVYWLFYLLDKFLNEIRYHRPTTRIHKQCVVKIKDLYDTILNFKSSYEITKGTCVP